MATRYILFLVFVLILFGSWAKKVEAQVDTVIFSYEEYIQNIAQYHPMAKQANLRLELAEAEMLGAKGMIDPMLSSSYNQKEFDDKQYYRQFQGKLRFPTRYGIDFVGGYENNQGIFLNPENTTDDFGLWNAGIEVNVLQGLLVNERVIALRQAEVFQELAQNERLIALNELFYQASDAYINWQQYYNFAIILEENISLALRYFENTKESFFGGEKTAMDTLEANVLYRDAIATQQKNTLQLIKARQIVENFLWFNNTAISLKDQAVPESYENDIFPTILLFESNEILNHPMILASINKLSYSEIEQRLKREKLKPKLKVKYNPLLATSENNLAPNYSINNFKWGVDFSMPLFMRSERADVQRGEIKIQSLELDIENKKNILLNKIEASWEQQFLINEQREILRQNVAMYRQLLEGENEKFTYGESSVFLVNKRQEKYVNSRLKLVEISIKRQLEILNFLYYTNGLIER